MKYQIVGKNVQVTESMEEAIHKKMQRIERYFDDSVDVRCVATISTAHLDQTIEVSILTKNISLRAKVSDTDLYAALDICIDRLEGQMRKMKTQLDRSKKKSLGENIRFEMLKELADEDYNDSIVRRKKLNLTPMDLDEALTRMDALDHSFFIYLDSTTGLVNVLYAREDGGYGVIEVAE